MSTKQMQFLVPPQVHVVISQWDDETSVALYIDETTAMRKARLIWQEVLEARFMDDVEWDTLREEGTVNEDENWQRGKVPMYAYLANDYYDTVYVAKQMIE